MKEVSVEGGASTGEARIVVAMRCNFLQLRSQTVGLA